MPKVLSGLIWVPAVSKDHKHTTQLAASKKRVNKVGRFFPDMAQFTLNFFTEIIFLLLLQFVSGKEDEGV